MASSKVTPSPGLPGVQRQFQVREFGIAHAFFMDSWWQMETILPSINATSAISTDEYGCLLAPDNVMRRLQQMSPDEMARIVASSCVAMTCLGYAMEHGLMLLRQLTTIDEQWPRPPHLVSRLYAELPGVVQRELDDLYAKAGYQDFEIEEQFGDPAPWPDTKDPGSGLKDALARWDEGDYLQASHYKYSKGAESPSAMQLVIPYMTLRFVDSVLSSAVAPRLGVSRQPIFDGERESTYPKVEWKDGTMFVTLPYQAYGRTLEAKWKPGVTTVVRIREAGTENWGVGFETPLNGCSFAGLKPGTKYEVMLAHKNAAGEGEPTIQEILAPEEGQGE